MAVRILSLRNVHVQYNDVNYEVTDSVGDKSKGDFQIKTKPGNATVAIIYGDGMIYWHQPPAAQSWEPIGAHLKVTLP